MNEMPPTLPPCPDTPNCVSSMEARDQKKVDALPWIESIDKTKERLQSVIDSYGRAKVTARLPNHWKAEFRTKIIGFVDDVDFLFDEKNKRVDVRSASRVGHYDFEANRKRIEAMRKAMQP